jgi:hypothetical protein
VGAGAGEPTGGGLMDDILNASTECIIHQKTV